MNLKDYDEIKALVDKGQIVGIGTAVNEAGEPHLVGVAGRLTRDNWDHLRQADGAGRALFALKAVEQARNHYGIPS